MQKRSFFIGHFNHKIQHKKKKTGNALKDSFHEIYDFNKITAKEIIGKLDKKLADKRVVQLDPNEVIEISNQLKHLIKKHKLKN